MASDIRTKRSRHHWVPRPIQIILRALGVMTTPAPAFPIDLLQGREQKRLVTFRKSYENWFRAAAYGDGHIEAWYVAKLEVYKQKKGVEHERVIAYLARTRSPEETRENPVEYKIQIERFREEIVRTHTSEEEVRAVIAGDVNRANSSHRYSFFPALDPDFEVSRDFEEALEEIVVEGKTFTTAAVKSLRFCHQSSTTVSKSTSESSALGSAVSSDLSDNIVHRGTTVPALDYISIVSGPPDPSTYLLVGVIKFLEPPPLPTITATTDPSIRPPRERQYLYFYELLALASTIHQRRACYRLFLSNCFWLAAMLVHTIRLYLEIDVSVWDGAKLVVVGGREDLGETAEVTEANVQLSEEMGRWMGIRITYVPKNSTLLKVLAKFTPDKEMFEDLIINARTQAVGVKRVGAAEEIAQRAEENAQRAEENVQRAEKNVQRAEENAQRAEESTRREREAKEEAEEKARAAEEKARVAEEKMQQMQRELEQLRNHP